MFCKKNYPISENVTPSQFLLFVTFCKCDLERKFSILLLRLIWVFLQQPIIVYLAQNVNSADLVIYPILDYRVFFLYKEDIWKHILQLPYLPKDNAQLDKVQCHCQCKISLGHRFPYPHQTCMLIGRLPKKEASLFWILSKKWPKTTPAPPPPLPPPDNQFWTPIR